MEINVKELRIGNLLLHSELGIVEIIAVGKDYIHCVFNGETFYEGVHSFSPIIITEEILISTGFKKDLHCGYSNVYAKQKLDISLYSKPDSNVYEIHNTMEPIQPDYVSFEYLHQLQNIVFDLYREELIFKS